MGMPICNPVRQQHARGDSPFPPPPHREYLAAISIYAETHSQTLSFRFVAEKRSGFGCDSCAESVLCAAGGFEATLDVG